MPVGHYHSACLPTQSPSRAVGTKHPWYQQLEPWYLQLEPLLPHQLETKLPWCTMMNFDGSPVNQESEASVHAAREADRLMKAMGSQPPTRPTDSEMNAPSYALIVLAMVERILLQKAKGTHFTSCMAQFTIDCCLQTQFSSFFNVL
jgi:hypothetical protein